MPVRKKSKKHISEAEPDSKDAGISDIKVSLNFH